MDNNEISQYVELGNFLKTRRSKVLPSQVGLPNGTRRRTSGLRREEVAQLAGISLTWYTWLEQGRSINISDRLLESLCNVLLLTKEERNHLFILSAKSCSANNLERSTITDSLQNVLNNLGSIPAYIMDDRWNVIAWNLTSCKVFCDFSKLEVGERNIVWLMFNDKEYMSLFDDWDFHARGIVARFRASCAKYVKEDWFTSFISKLKTENASFREWWSMYDIHGMSDIIKDITHPIVGSLSFEFSSFDVSDNTNLKLILHTPRVETKTTERIKLLMNG